MENYDDLRKGERGAWLSIIAYIFLAVLKIVVGTVGNSDALQADGLNNTTDIVASVALLIGLKISRIPPDEDHLYGHRRTETISSLIASFIMFLVGIEVVWRAIVAFWHQEFVTPSMLTAIVALFSGIVMYVVYLINNNLAKKVDSQAVKAAAYDNRSDAYVSFGTFIGITGAVVGLAWLDNVTALLVGLLIIYTAWKIFYDAAHTLTDGFDIGKIQAIHTIIADVPQVHQVLDIKARMNGNRIWIDATISVKADLNVAESHAITEKIETAIRATYPNAYTLVHIEPYFEEKQ
ncbi:cation transporter [Listeria booriae]|uniref:Transporter n=1 Tax=Listeria booriae TaxID=1552123 RepID=A0A099WN21_9LIST|nr:cation diffusion facilitator family transporter [Listeria booriae]KGL45530.1 transporter [Listeria booriae]MBC1560273.1 cation transporter [Listeria booriae]MBC1804768.1 cation transporter [Listeria booriae]MBC2024930.1 cation transporter [Listeria booriae]MBC2264279.1 cation transporter [Listeria booriae]